jgi:DNA primase catalytic core
MARIPQAEIERLKEEVSVERLVEASGIALKRSGKDLLGACPFHEDGTPSLVVTPAKNLWHCFGCQVGGGPIDWVMKRNGVSFRHAVELLREGVTSMRPARVASVRALPAPVAMDADDQALLNQVVGYYHETLKQSPEALAYLQSRGLDHPDLIDTFRLGFANRTLGLRLPNKQRKEGAEIRARLERIGLYRASGHEHFTGSLVVPVLDEGGNVTEVYGRKIGDHLRPGTPLHLYLPGPHRGVWNLEAVKASREVILCEALIDAMTFWCAGFRNVTSSYGVEGFTDEILESFKAQGVERVLIAYDRDEAGDRAAAKLTERLMGEGIECWRVQFPQGMDANEYALKVTPSAKSLGVAIRKAVWLGKGEKSAPVLEPVVAAVGPAPPEEPTEPPSLAAEGPKEVRPISPPVIEAGVPASPVPPGPAPEVDAEVRESEVAIVFGDRRYRVRGLARNMSYDVMKLNVLASRGERFHVDTFDLYAAKARGAFTVQAAIELGVADEVVKGDLGRLLLKLERLQDEQIQKALQPKPVEAAPIDETARREALALLESPDLLSRILADFEACGIVGEATNKLVGYLAAVSRKLERPLAVVVQSSSAAGKSSLMEAIIAFVPEEERVKFSAMTGQSLFYMGETDLQHKILAIVEEEGASRASYALKLLQSEGELSIASTGKDPQTGSLVTQEYRVKGPVMMFLTTTAVTIDEELLNRCLVLSVDEDRAQTAAIHRLQRERRTLQGLHRRQEREGLIELHRNAQRLLKPLAVVNPHAERLTFPDAAIRLRRDHEKYLTLIDAIALLHQHQREVKATSWRGRMVEYVEVQLSDIARANALAHEVLGHSLDEVPPQTRRLLGEIVKLVQARAAAEDVRREAVRFTRRELRSAIGWGDTQLKTHLARLTELEFVLAHREGQGFRYELAYDGDGSASPHLSGLIDAEGLMYDARQSGLNAERSGLGRPPVGGRSGAGRGEDSTQSSMPAEGYAPSNESATKTHVSKRSGAAPSYGEVAALAAASRA